MDEKELKEILDQIGELGGNVENLRKQADKLESDNKSAADERGKIAAVGKEMGDAIEKMQALTATQEEVNKRLDDIGAKQERIAANTSKEDRAAIKVERHEEHFINKIKMLHGKMTREEEAATWDKEDRDMLATVDTTGGFIIPVNLSNEILEKFIDINPVRQEANVVTISTGGQWTEVAEKAHPTPENVGETGTASEDEIEFIEFDIKVHHIRSVVPISDTLTADVPAMNGLITRVTGRKFQQLESQNFITGNGVKKARGFAFNIQASSNTNDVWSVTGGGTQLIETDDFMKLIKDVDYTYWTNGKFYMNQTTWGNVLNLKDAVTGGYMLRNLEASPAMVIRGYPVVIMNTIADEGDEVYPLFFGDMRQLYTIVDRSGIALLLDHYTDYPVTKFKFSKRVGGRVVLPAALRALKTT